jgi:hypothetical protein
MVRIADEFQDIPLGNTHVFQKMPRTVWDTGSLAVDVLKGEVFDYTLKAHMGIVTGK